MVWRIDQPFRQWVVFRQSSSCRLPGSEYFSATPSVVAIFGLGASTMSASFFTPGLLRSHLQLQRNGVFLLAIISSRCPSDLTSLRYDTLKTDCQTYLGHLIIIYCLPMGKDVCAILALGDSLAVRRPLSASHDCVFCEFPHPHCPISTSAFAVHLSWCLREAGISAPPGSTRAIFVSDAFRSGIASSEILRAGIRSGASTFFRHCLRPAASDSMTR